MSNTNAFGFVTGIKGETTIPANAAVLLADKRVREEGHYITKQEFLAVTGVKSTKDVDIIMPMLAWMVANAKVNAGFDAGFKFIKLAGEDQKTGISATNAYNKFLKGDALYKSDSNGALTKALVMDGGLALNKTALKVRPTQLIVTKTGKELKALMHLTAKAIVAQATLRSGIVRVAQSIFADAYDEAPKATKTPKAPKAGKKSA